MSPPPEALAEIMDGSTIGIGSSESFPDGTSLTLHIDANVYTTDFWVNSSFTIKRGADTLLVLDSPGEADISVFAGETLSVGFTQSLNYYFDPDCRIAINLWVVPEPSTFVLLGMGACGLAFYGWRK